MSGRWRVRLPRGVRAPFEVYVNGVRQVEGRDFERAGDLLLFDRPLEKEGSLGFWRWFIGAFGIGTYRRNDTVDVRYERQGRPLVAHALDIEPPPDHPRLEGTADRPGRITEGPNDQG